MSLSYEIQLIPTGFIFWWRKKELGPDMQVSDNVDLDQTCQY